MSEKWTWRLATLTDEHRRIVRQINIEPDEIWQNGLYEVWKRREAGTDIWPAMIWLSIKRRDKSPIHDWRHLQRIKDELVGPEHEAVELYPAHSRVIDTANQYHLWVMADPANVFPFGFFNGRWVADKNSPEEYTALIRSIESDPRTSHLLKDGRIDPAIMEATSGATQRPMED